MKKSILFTSALAVTVALTAGRVVAHPGGHESEGSRPPRPDVSDHGREPATQAPESIADILKEIEKQQGLLVKIVDSKKLGDAHDHAFVIRDLANTLIGKTPAAKKADAEVAVKKIADLAGDIDKSSAAGAQKTTESNVKAMGRAIKTLQTILPHGH